jgi:hypothetical protein
MRHNPAKGTIDGYYRLVESYRNSDDRVCHRTLLNVGFLDGVATIDQLNLIQKYLNRKASEAMQGKLFSEEKDSDALVNRFVEELWERLVNEKRIDTGASPSKKIPAKNRELVYVDSIRHKDVREIGAEWLSYQALEQLKLADFLANQGWEESDIRLALTHIISRAVYPASELETSRWIRENSAVCEVTGYPVEAITKDRLYNISLRLYQLHETLEQYLSLRTNDLFDIEDKIMLYDLTNTYFEGRMKQSEIARFGRSKEKRNDCKIVVLALVVNPEGFIKYSAVLEGNMNDASSLEGMINKLRVKTSSTARKAVVVMDAGIATEANLRMIKEKGYDYLCVSRSSMKNYLLCGDTSQVQVTDRKKQKIMLEKVTSPDNEDYYLKVESEARKLKECSMNNRFQAGFELGLSKIAAGLVKKGGVKQEDKVNERIGRLKQKYPSIHRYYQISYEIETETVKKRTSKELIEKRTVKSISWNVREDMEINKRSGIYFLRTSIKDTEKILWDSYNTIREIEATNRVLKTDLDLRPIYHKKDESTMAHLHLGILAYWVVNTIRYQLKKKEAPEKALDPNKEGRDNSIHFQWKEIVRIMNTQKAVTTLAQNKADEVMMIRKCSEPNEKVKAIYDKLNYRHTPFKKKKFVVHKTELEKTDFAYYQEFHSD